MIPCSKLEEILREYKSAGMSGPFLVGEEAKALAAFITSKSFEAYQEERAPRVALLHAAMIVIEQRLLEGEEPVTLGGDGYEKKIFVHGGEDEHGALRYEESDSLIDAIIAYAKSTD